MASYCSFLVVNPSHGELVESLGAPEWRLRLHPDPSKRFWFGEGGSYSIEHPGAIGEQPQTMAAPGQLVIVDADEAHDAHNIVQLACAAYDVVEGDPTRRIGIRLGYEMPPDASAEREVFQTQGHFERFVYRLEIPLAMFAATFAWPNRSLVYAIHKLAQSYNTESVTWWSLRPGHGQVFERTSELHAAHVGSSVAINLAFAAIEELQLQIKSGATQKRWNDNATGEWNPSVLQDIEDRLRKAGVDPNHEFTWTVRGASTPAEASVKPELGRPEPYADRQMVRDFRVTVPEALHKCSVLRDFLMAHRFSEASASVGAYEVHNVQSVARYLILATCRIWNVWTDNLAQKRLGENEPDPENG